MDTQKLYNWNKQDMDIGILDNEQERKEAQDALALQQRKQMMDNIGIDILNDEHAINSEDVASPIMDRRTNVPAHMPPGMAVFSEKQSLIRSGNYSFLSKKGVMTKGTRSTPSKKYMKPILDNLQKIDDLLKEQFDSKKKSVIDDLFREAIVSCETYIDNRNPWTSEGKARLQMVKDFHAQIRQEAIWFSDRVAQLESLPVAEQSKLTWLDVLGKVRTQTYEDGKDNCKVTVGGAGTSTVYIVEKNGKKSYFKENEKLPTGTIFNIMENREKNMSNKDDDTSKRRAGYMVDIRRELLRTYKNNEKDMKNALYQHVVREKSDAVVLFLGQFDKKSEIYYKLLELSAEKEEHPELKDNDYDYINNEFKEIMKLINLRGIAVNNAQIEEKSEISKRNVATSRLAEMLGLGNMVAKSEMADVIINGKKMKGITMEEAAGEKTTDVKNGAEKEGKVFRYSPLAFRQLLNLQIFDIICGQVDRNGANYLCEKGVNSETGNVEITKIKAIDNDMAFGKLTYKQLFERGSKGLNRMRNIENRKGLHVPAVDKALADKIFALDEKKINYAMCDILSKEERKALFDRIKGVQKALRKKLNEEAKNKKAPSIFIEDSKEQDNWKAAYEKFTQKIEKGIEADKKRIAGLQKKLEYEERTGQGLAPAYREAILQNIRNMITNTQNHTGRVLGQETYIWHVGVATN